jgi:arylsulfatase A-like enzyme
MDRRTFLLGSLAAAGVACSGGSPAATSTPTTSLTGKIRQIGDYELRQLKADPDAPNVLMISLDDQNDWVGFLNAHPGAVTPNLDGLAARSLVFDAAYCTAPMCLPSRTSIGFGLHPYQTDVYDHSDASNRAQEELRGVTPSLIDDFWAAGYGTFGTGKVFGNGEAKTYDEFYAVESYASPVDVGTAAEYADRYDPDWISPWTAQPIGDGSANVGTSVDFGPNLAPPTGGPDGNKTSWASEVIQRNHDRPFFLGVGVGATHLPWRVPQEFFDMHPIEEVVVPEIRPGDLSDLSPYAINTIAYNNRLDLDRLQKSGLLEEAVQAYQASTSYMDWSVGQLLDTLAASPYADNTIIVVWSDHGFHLGEKLHLHKFTLWERATRVPFVIHQPGRFDRGEIFDPPVSLIDIGPTLAELCPVKIYAPHEGASLVPVVDSPDLADEHPPIMTWLEGNYAVRQGQYRYIRYNTGDAELYDHEADPEEYTNVANWPLFAGVRATLDGYLPPA